MSQIGLRGENTGIWFGQGFLMRSDMTLTHDLETQFKVTVHPLPRGTLWMKYDPAWARGEKLCSVQVISDRWMGKQTYHYREPAERGPNYTPT